MIGGCMRHSNKFKSKLINHISLLSPAAMTGAIKLFQYVQNFYQTLGIHPPIQSYQTFSLNRRNLFFLSCSVLTFILSTAYLLFDAQSIQDFGIPFCASVIILSGFFIYIVQIWRNAEIFQLIEHFEKFIEQSKSTKNCSTFSENEILSIIMINFSIGLDRTLYAALNERIERISKLVYFCLTYLSAPGALLPPFALSVVNYFVYDLGDESFYLTYPSM